MMSFASMDRHPRMVKRIFLSKTDLPNLNLPVCIANSAIPLFVSLPIKEAECPSPKASAASSRCCCTCAFKHGSESAPSVKEIIYLSVPKLARGPTSSSKSNKSVGR